MAAKSLSVGAVIVRRLAAIGGLLIFYSVFAYAETAPSGSAVATRSLVPPVFLPDGREFRTWEPAVYRFTRTLYVDQRHPRASDTNAGTAEMPFKTIGRAAELLQPGERVLVASGVYREWVRPVRGGTDPQHIISYEAAPGAHVVVKGSEILRAKFEDSRPWAPDPVPGSSKTFVRGSIRMIRLPRSLFPGYNPFAICNYPTADEIPYWNLRILFGKPMAKFLFQYRGLMYQDGKRLRQVSRFTELAGREGTYWVESNGLVVHLTPIGNVDPSQSEWEITTREQLFAPEEYYLGYIRLKGFVLELAGNGFPFPQRGAVSTMHGHHWILEDNTIRWANGVGMDIGSQGGASLLPIPPDRMGHHIVRGNTFIECGICGLCGPILRDTLIEDNTFRGNAWHDVEDLAESGGIKTHQNANVLVQRNRVYDTLNGPGIYLDNLNENCRVTRNVVVNTGSLNTDAPGPGPGGIYIEASQSPNWVDHNVVWNSTRTNGIYSFFISNLTVAHNLVGGCAGAGIMLVDVGGRPEGNPGGGNRILNNLLVDNGWQITLRTPKNISNNNLFGTARQAGEWRVGRPEIQLGFAEWQQRWRLDLQSHRTEMTMGFDPQSGELRRKSGEPLPACPRVPGFDQDFWGRTRDGATTIPGPFAKFEGTTEILIVDPKSR
jgi:hypothetical protein